RAQECVDFIKGSNASSLVIAVVQLVAQKKPDGAAEVLLAYLPFTEDESIEDQVREALATVAVQQGKVDQAILSAMVDPDVSKRRVAAEVVCQVAMAEHREALRKLLKDIKPEVRLRVALALANARDEEAYNVLIATLADAASLEAARQAEDMLQRLAGPQKPAVVLGTDELSRKRSRDAWAAWWKTTEGTATLDYVKKNTPNETDLQKIEKLIELLGNDSFKVREKAEADLVKLKSMAIAQLEKAEANKVLEIRNRANRALKTIREAPTAPLTASFVRVMGVRKPGGALQSLLNFVPFAEDDSVIEEVRGALVALALPDGRLPDKALITALTD